MPRRKTDESNRIEASAAFAAGFCQGWLTNFAYTQEVSASLLAERVAEILHASGTRFENPMLEVHEDTTSPIHRVSEVEVGRGARGHVPRASEGAKVKSVSAKKQSDYWKKNFPTAEARAKEVRRRLAMRKKKQAA